MPTIAKDTPQEVVDLANMIAWERIPEHEQRAKVELLEKFIQDKIKRKVAGRNYGGTGRQRVRNAVPQWVLDKLGEYDYTPFSSIMRSMMKVGAIAYMKKQNIPLIDSK